MSPLIFTMHFLCNQLIINYAQLGILNVKGLTAAGLAKEILLHVIMD